MEISLHEELRRGLKLFNEGKDEEVLELLKDFEKRDDITPHDIHWFNYLKATLLFFIGRIPESLKISEKGYEEALNKKNTLFIIDFLTIKWSIFLLLGRAPQLKEDVFYFEKLLKSVEDEPESEYKLREAFFLYMKGYHLWWEGLLDDALTSTKRALTIFEDYDSFPYLLTFILFLIGVIYAEKGELDLALEAQNESLALTRGSSMIFKLINATSHNNIGNLNFQKGNLDIAVEHFETSLKILGQYPYPIINIWVGINYNDLISTYLYKNSSEKAKQCLDRFQNYLETSKIPQNFYWYRFSKAKVLKSSSRIRNRAEAENILRELIKGHDVLVKSGSPGIADEFTLAIVELCDFYIQELKLTQDLEILDDIEPYIERLLKESERTNSYLQQAQALLLKGQLALLQVNMGEARKYLTQAQHIAEEHDLQLLARTISREHDKLLEQLYKWKDFEAKTSSISERMELVSLDKTIDTIQKMRPLDPPELVNEQPVLLLIIGQDGVPYFNYSFIKGWDDQDLFSGFMSAFNSFSSEFFSKSIDRIKIDENLILFQPVESFMVCYVIKGQSYPALLKLTRFSDAIKWKPEIWDALNKAVKTSEVLELTNPTSLGDVVNEIFNLKL
ncbi:MAG: tetratricopeptide repeat protein [Promethearchaeota archaeon]|jgi:tetratricopeptide (TPR) repeat protein